MAEWEVNEMNHDLRKASNRATTGVTLGATALGVAGLNALSGGGLLGGILGGGRGGMPACSEQMPVNRYEAEQNARIAQLETQVSLRDSNTYTDQKLLELYKYFDGELKTVNGHISAQAVQNQRTADAFEMVRNDMLCCKQELYASIQRERDDRCCNDNAIVNYLNNNFYPKQVANITTGTETTAQLTYNPLPRCGNGCGCVC